MGINEMELHWRLNWLYRPTQCDDIETSVTDYYESFCDWKDTMKIHACPAGEADYVDAFIQGLKPDIRLRLESKGRSTRRLGAAFYDAKLEESLISIDEAFNKIKAKFEAHKPFDSEKDKGLIVAATYIDESPIDKRAEMTVGPHPIQGEDMSVKMYYDQFCIWISKLEGVNYIGDQESHVDEFFCGLRKDLRERVLQSKWKTHRLSDALRRVEIDETFLSWEKDSGNNDANDVFEYMPNPESEHSDELQEAEDASDVKGDDLVVQIEAQSRINVSPISACKVFDDLPRLTFIAAVGYKVIDSGEDADTLHNPQTEDALTWLNLFSKEFIENVDGSFLAKQTEMQIAHIMFDELPRPFSVQPNEETSGHKSYILPVDCVPQAFDPCSVTNEFSHLIFFPRIDIEFCKGEISRLIFDPGGVSLYYKVFFSLKPNSVMQNLYFRLNESDSARVDHCWIYQQSALMYLANGECKKVIYFTRYDALFLFDPGGRKNGIRNLGSNQHRRKVMEEYTSVAFLEMSSLNGEMLSNLVIFIQIGKVLMVVFDPGGSWYHMRYLHFQLNGELSFSAKCLNSQAAQQLLEKMLSTVLLIDCWLGLVEYAVNTKEVSLNTVSTKFNLEHVLPTIVNQLVDNCFAGGMTKNGLIPSDKMFDIVNILRSMASFTDGHWNIILLGKAPKLMDFILGKGHDIHGYMVARSHKVQHFLDFKAKGSRLKHILARVTELPVFIWDPGPFLGSIHPWGQ